MNEALESGYTCECGKRHEFPPYVYAHWDTELVRTCECGRQRGVLKGRTVLLGSKNQKHRS